MDGLPCPAFNDSTEAYDLHGAVSDVEDLREFACAVAWASRLTFCGGEGRLL